MHLRAGIIFLICTITQCKRPAHNLYVAAHPEVIVYSEICQKRTRDPDIVSYKLPEQIVHQLNENLGKFVKSLEEKVEHSYHFTESLSKCRAGASYDFDFRTTYESQEILSLVFDIDFQSAAAAHGLRLQYGVSLSLLDGSIIDPYSRLSGEAQRKYDAAYFKAFQKYKTDHPDCASALENVPHPSLARNGYFAEDTYTIIFNPYEIAPYACSTIEINIPITIMKSLSKNLRR